MTPAYAWRASAGEVSEETLGSFAAAETPEEAKEALVDHGWPPNSLVYPIISKEGGGIPAFMGNS